MMQISKRCSFSHVFFSSAKTKLDVTGQKPDRNGKAKVGKSKQSETAVSKERVNRNLFSNAQTQATAAEASAAAFHHTHNAKSSDVSSNL
jgi:Holliday junction resolvasome RuvABC endonuclease subunit